MTCVVVENEIRIREGLINLIKKIDSVYQVVGEAENGKEGFALISKKKPDLVITDIRMPELDGLEMLQQLKKTGIKVEAIVLSAYSDFSYAKEAIQLGVNEYLLKPISVDELSRSLKNIEIRIASEQEKKELLSLAKILQAVISGELELELKMKSFLSENYDLEADNNFILTGFYLGVITETQYKNFSRTILRILSRKKEIKFTIIRDPSFKNLILVFYNVENADALYNWIKNLFLTELERNGAPEFIPAYTFCSNLDLLKETAITMHSLMDWNLVLGNHTLISLRKIETSEEKPIDYPSYIEQDIRKAICSPDPEKFQSGITSFISYFQKKNDISPKTIKESFTKFCWAVMNVAHEVCYENYKQVNQQELLEKINQAITWQEMTNALLILKKLVPEAKKSTGNESVLITRVKNMIHEFYVQGITLEEIAAKNNVTPEYLSTLFHAETGNNFSNYIKKLKIQKAKELLIGTDLKLYNISKQVGYRDSKYFCRVFTETTGINPSKYRKENRKN